AEEQLGGGAAVDALVVHAGLGLFAGAAAADNGHPLLHGAGLHAQHTGDLHSAAGAAGDAQVGALLLAGGQGLGVAVAAGVAAGAAVGAGQAFTDGGELGILRNSHDGGRDDQHD